MQRGDLCSGARGRAIASRDPGDLATAGGPVDRFYDRSIGWDFPGTLIRSDTQAQLVPAVRELGLRYIRFHDVFHDVLGTVKDVDGTRVYDWTKLDHLSHALLAKRIRPCCRIGFYAKCDIKAIDPQLRVGGPSTAGAAWVPELPASVAKNNLPIDFVSTHTYGVDGGFFDE